MQSTRDRWRDGGRWRRSGAWVPTVLLVAGMGLGCSGRAAGPGLPEGNARRGKVAFVKLQCSACHTVAGVSDLPAPVATPPVPVVLGGLVGRVRTDAELMTSITRPDHRLASGYAVEWIARGGSSRMGDYSDTMTVRQLADLVAFLQSRYEVVRAPSAP